MIEMHVPTGLAAYPDDPYYDPNRPAWLPHWIDTPTESIRKWSGYTPTVEDLQRQQIEQVAKTDPQAAAALLAEITRAQAQQYGQQSLMEKWVLPAALATAGVSLLLLLVSTRRR